MLNKIMNDINHDKNKSIAVLGLGIFGTTVARELSYYDCDVIAIDQQEHKIQNISETVTKAAIGDITDYEFLKNIGIEHCDLAIIASGTHLESSVLAIMHCKKLGVKKIIAKARSHTYEEVLYEIGADIVIRPERDSGRRLASKILRNKIDEILHLDEETAIVEFDAPESWIGKTAQELDLRRKYELNLIGTRNEKGGPLNHSIGISEPIQSDTILVAIAKSNVFEKFDYLGYFNK